MSTEVAPESEAPKPKRLPMILLAVAGIGIGAVAGAMVVTPMLSRPGAKPHAAAAKEGEEEKEGGEHGEKGAARVLYTVDNLVLNPAGTGGTRFLMLTISFELKKAGLEEKLKEQDAEVRDRLIGLFAAKPMEELTDPTKRELIKQQALTAVAPLLPKGAITHAYIPQFVIQ